MATETSSIGDEWEWISYDTAEILRATVESAFTADPRKNWSAEELARWIRDVALVSAKKNVWDHAAALGEFLVNGLGYVTGEDYMSMDLGLMITIGEDGQVTQGSDSQAADMEKLNDAKREASQGAHQELRRGKKINVERRQIGCRCDGHAQECSTVCGG